MRHTSRTTLSGSNMGATAVWPSPLPVEEHADSYVGRRAVEFLSDYEEDRPFCAFVGFGGPHEPWDAPGRFAQMYDPAETPPPTAPEGTEPGPWVPHEAAQWQRTGRHNLARDDIARLRANYYGKISLIDEWSGRILDTLERRGLLDDALILFWSDHGEMLGDHDRLYKSRFYESALRVPLVLRWPGRVPGGETRDALASTVDIMPTILEAAGVGVPDSCDGLSLLPVLRNAAAPFREATISEVRSGGHRNRCVVTQRWKYAERTGGTPLLLYDLCADPGELDNLVGHPDKAHVEAELRTRLRRMAGRSEEAPNG